jgi:hypothetical protein
MTKYLQVFALLVLAPSCTSSGGDDEPVVDDCADEVSGDWESVDEFGCPLVDPSCTYRHTLNLDGSNYAWSPDETFEGPYTCSDGVIDARDVDGAAVFTANFDANADTLELTWDGQTAPVPYRRVP